MARDRALDRRGARACSADRGRKPRQVSTQGAPVSARTLPVTPAALLSPRERAARVARHEEHAALARLAVHGGGAA